MRYRIQWAQYRSVSAPYVRQAIGSEYASARLHQEQGKYERLSFISDISCVRRAKKKIKIRNDSGSSFFHLSLTESSDPLSAYTRRVMTSVSTGGLTPVWIYILRGRMRRMLVGGKLKSKNGINSRQIYARSFDDLRSPMSSGEVLAEDRLRIYGIILTHLPFNIHRPTCSWPVQSVRPGNPLYHSF